MTVYDKIVSLIGTMIKTFLSLLVCFIGFLLLFFNIFIRISDEQTMISLVIVTAIFFLWVFWQICPDDTKNWIKNWTRSTTITKDNEEFYDYVADGLKIVFPNIDFSDKRFIDHFAKTSVIMKRKGIDNRVAILLKAIQTYKPKKK